MAIGVGGRFGGKFLKDHFLLTLFESSKLSEFPKSVSATISLPGWETGSKIGLKKVSSSQTAQGICAIGSVFTLTGAVVSRTGEGGTMISEISLLIHY